MFPRSFPTFAVVLVALLPGGAVAQPGTGAIAGVIHDSSGATVPGATVSVANEDGGVGVVSVSSDVGAYRADSLPPGRYRLEASLDGFETVVRQVALAAAETAINDITLTPARLTEGVVVTARRVEEEAQTVPIPLSVLSGNLVNDAGAFNVNRLKELIPTVQFYSTNPRNSAINIRGLGAPFGLTNDGLEPGVGLYIDGVFYARPASATLDFLDVEQIEVLRGPQGTLFGKNTTAGAINVTTKKPSFTSGTELEVDYGSFQFLQVKASVTGPLARHLAGRISFSGTQRDGTTGNVQTREAVNTLNNAGLRGQLLFAPSSDLAVTLTMDDTRQRPNGYTQVVAGVAPTLRPPNRQYDQVAASLNYAPPSFNAFDRLTDIDSPLRSNQDLGGASLTVDWKLGPGRLNSTTAWRYWNWDPSSDRDFIGLPVTTISAAPSKQQQWAQEIRYAEDVSRRVSFVVGAFAFHQTIDSDPVFRQEQGSAAAAFLLPPSAAASTPGLLDGYGYNQYVDYGNTSAAVFGQLQWTLNDRVRLLPGLRFNYDQKAVDFEQQIYGGLQTDNPVLVALQRSVLAPQAYKTDVSDTNTSGQVTLAYKATDKVNAYATYATGFKSVGLNLNGLPTDALGRAVLSAATVKPEDVRNFEVGIKTTPLQNVTANLTVFDTEIKNFQTQVTNGSVGVIRGYLANAEKVRVRGAEFDGSYRASRRLTFYGAAAYTDGKYVTFTDAPPPLEHTGGPQYEDISGTVLPGISKWAHSLGGEYSHTGMLVGRSGDVFGALEASYRSDFSSSASYSRYLVVNGYSLLNARVGFRSASGWTLTIWSRNLLNKDYFELLTAAPGNTGLFVGQPGDPRTIGVTLRVSLRRR
ncbi:MAG: TonB-dependent receptor [Acidobacteria bacterium]|nr:MAG: TonB-dependent receptor [Acidobacteriota bacterium]